MSKKEPSRKLPPIAELIDEALPPKDRLELVQRLIMNCQQGLSTRTMTVGDFVRLLSLEKELAGEERVDELRVTWVQSFETVFDS